MTPLAGHTDRTIHRIAHFGTFDVENYGDLLFPLLVERRLDGAANDTGLDIEVVHVSPVGGEPVWGDCVPTISTEEAMTRPFDGVIVGGGHIIHGQACDVEPYVSAGDRRLFAYADLWLGSTLLADELGIPIVWNAPGVPGPFGAATSELAFWAASQADYLSVRDQRSCDFLERTGYRGEIAIGPDTALEVDLLWSPEELRNATKEAFSNRGHAPAERAIAIHMNSRYLRSGIREIASLLDDFCMKKGSTAILMALGPCHEDDVLQRQVGRMMKTNP
ncbi:MAG TPA: polysaccharide pyruvyl transferase family protein, partial [Deltaproteobacteria bacterium]|nr:polysaccharide pyruvyl transferase family protein [Deltaproteobacteria bacterium]